MSEQRMIQGGGTASNALLLSYAEEKEITIDGMELCYRLIGSWKLILCLALVFALAVGITDAYFVTPQYSATAIIYVLSPESIINVSSLQLGTALTSDYIKVFEMWEVHEAVISNLHLPYSYAQMRGMLSVTNTSGTRMLDITFTSPSPEEAAAVANEYAEVASRYIQDTMAIDKPNKMSSALVPTNPVSPHTARDIALGLIGGALLGAAIVFVRYLMDDKLKTAEEIRRYTGLATLAVVPVEESEIAGENGKNRKPWRRKKK